MWKNHKKYAFWTFFCRYPLLRRVSGLQTFPEKKKKNLYFFFSKKWKNKKQNSWKSSEWVAVNYSRKKKYDTFDQSLLKI